MGDIEPTSRELHYVSFCLGTKGAWGHASPETIFSLRLLRLHRHISLTLFMPSNFRSKLSAVFDDLQLDDEELQRLRRVWYECPEESPFDANTGEVDDGQYRKWGDWMGSLVVSKYADYMRVSFSAWHGSDWTTGSLRCRATPQLPTSSTTRRDILRLAPTERISPILASSLTVLWRSDAPHGEADANKLGLCDSVSAHKWSVTDTGSWYGGRQTVFGRAVRAYMTEVDAGVSRDGAYEKVSPT